MPQFGQQPQEKKPSDEVVPIPMNAGETVAPVSEVKSPKSPKTSSPKRDDRAPVQGTRSPEPKIEEKKVVEKKTEEKKTEEKRIEEKRIEEKKVEGEKVEEKKLEEKSPVRLVQDVKSTPTAEKPSPAKSPQGRGQREIEPMVPAPIAMATTVEKEPVAEKLPKKERTAVLGGWSASPPASVASPRFSASEQKKELISGLVRQTFASLLIRRSIVISSRRKLSPLMIRTKPMLFTRVSL